MVEEASYQPEPIKVARRRKTRNQLMIVAATITAVMTVLLYLYYPPPDPPNVIRHRFTATISPSDSQVPAGRSVELEVSAFWDGHPISNGLRFQWSSSIPDSGELSVVPQKVTKFTAGPLSGSTAIFCEVNYRRDLDHTYRDTAMAHVTIGPPVIDSVVVVPSRSSLMANENRTFAAAVFDSVGAERYDATVNWSLWNASGIRHYLSNTSGFETIFRGLDQGLLTINATATLGGLSSMGFADVSIWNGSRHRTVDYRWHDMFNVPNGEWWDQRWGVTSVDEPITDIYPYLYRWYGSKEGNVKIYSSARLNIVGREMFEINMCEDPEFLPLLGYYRGGTAEIDWHMQFLTGADYPRYPSFVENQDDGWIVVLSGTVRLDSEAARSVMGLSLADFNDFLNWWSNNASTFRQEYVDWLNYEGKVRLDIWNTYLYPFSLMYVNFDAVSTGNQIVLSYDVVGWGLEVLMASWLREAFMPAEWRFEDFNMHATVGPEFTDLDIETAVEYALLASQTTEEGTPCWRWEPRLGDVVPSSPEHPYSDYDPYSPDFRVYQPFAAGSDIWGTWTSYDYTPSAFNLSTGERLIFEWPAGDAQMFLVHGGEFYNTTQLFGAIEVRYSEPMWGDLWSEQFTIDNATRSLTYSGPFDMWTWSKTQTAHEHLANEWDRVGLLPYGLPMIEFAVKLDDLSPYLAITALENPVGIGESVGFKVICLDQYNRPHTFYNGTVRFFSNDSLAVLPPDYTFDSALDNGSHNFTVTFNTQGYANLTVVDVNNPYNWATVTLIVVVPELTSIEMEPMPLVAETGVPFSARMMVLNQLGHRGVGQLVTIFLSQ